jgi:hypothetical protein
VEIHCEIIPVWRYTNVACGVPATTLLYSGCIHEHVYTWNTCDGCRDFMVAHTSQMHCDICKFNKRLPHLNCPIYLKTEPLLTAV